MTLNICMITYNHQDYITDAIEGILKQKTNFLWKLVIGEDFSTDNTRNICLDYATKYPDKITLITSSANVGMQQNFLRTYKACDAEYIAFCEGDDYWTDPLKLQKQVDFLMANTNYSGCFHNVLLKIERDGAGSERIQHNSLAKDTFNTEDVLGPWFIASPSFVFVNYPDFKLPDWFFNCQYGDLPFMLLLSLRGDFKYLDEVMGVYRLHENGMSNVHKSYDKIMVMVYIYSSFDIHTHFKYHSTVRNAVKFEVDQHIPPKEITTGTKQKNGIGNLKNYFSKIK